MAEIKPIKNGEALKIDLDIVIFLSESLKNIWIETNEAITAKRRVNILKEEVSSLDDQVDSEIDLELDNSNVSEKKPSLKKSATT